MKSQKRIAVFFGGRSPEHDVSVVTGLQILGAIDPKFEAFPVYITTDGVWLTGDVLRKRENYMLHANNRAQTIEVTLDVTAGKTGRLVPKKTGLFGSGKAIEFDVAIPSFHGLFGEDGNLQGLFEIAGVAYAGMRTLASSVLMDKAATKKAMQGIGIPVLPYAVLKRPNEGYMIARGKIEEALREKNIAFPCIVKPAHLGSSIGVAKATNAGEIAACLPAIFEYDEVAIIEPFVPNMVEYNVAVTKAFGGVKTSAIERPKNNEELLDFKKKYLSGGTKGQKGGGKQPGQASQGMLSLTREINPRLDPKTEENIRGWAVQMYEGLDGTGAPRIDFIGNLKSGEIWLNEVNPWPGSIGYFLWEAAPEPKLFSELLTALIEEAIEERKKRNFPKDSVPVDARLFRRPV
ncbi:MAG: D-alanine--D-alanine ligase [Alphaproteobacteria bacterium PRO2]|nr:D-alanine--D-alanine ligase [Alphaproteobacteria bacterium PRO2]